MQPDKNKHGDQQGNKEGIDRREMMAASVALAAVGPSLLGTGAKTTLPVATEISPVASPDSLYHGHS